MGRKGFGRGGQKKERKPAEQWLAGSDVRELADDIIAENHAHLVDARIVYLMRYPSWKSRGVVVGGTARLATPTDRALLIDKDIAFVITLNAEVWDHLSEATKRAMLDHELSHCEEDGDKLDQDDPHPWRVVGHDVEDFTAIIQRHGLWQDELRGFADACRQQLELFEQRGERRAGRMRAAEAASEAAAEKRLEDTDPVGGVQ